MIFVFINILTFLLRLVVFCDRAIHKCSPPLSPLLLSLSGQVKEMHFSVLLNSVLVIWFALAKKKNVSRNKVCPLLMPRGQASGRRSSMSFTMCSFPSATVTSNLCIVAALSAWVPEQRWQWQHGVPSQSKMAMWNEPLRFQDCWL